MYNTYLYDAEAAFDEGYDDPAEMVLRQLGLTVLRMEEGERDCETFVKLAAPPSPRPTFLKDTEHYIL